MEIVFLPEADEDLEYWKKTGNKAVLKKIAQLVKSISEDAYRGIGKPEPLKYDLSGKWSRRINQEHRLVYRVNPYSIEIFSLKGHYKK